MSSACHNMYLVQHSLLLLCACVAVAEEQRPKMVLPEKKWHNHTAVINGTLYFYTKANCEINCTRQCFSDSTIKFTFANRENLSWLEAWMIWAFGAVALIAVGLVAIFCIVMYRRRAKEKALRRQERAEKKARRKKRREARVEKKKQERAARMRKDAEQHAVFESYKRIVTEDAHRQYARAQALNARASTPVLRTPLREDDVVSQSPQATVTASGSHDSDAQPTPPNLI